MAAPHQHAALVGTVLGTHLGWNQYAIPKGIEEPKALFCVREQRWFDVMTTTPLQGRRFSIATVEAKTKEPRPEFFTYAEPHEKAAWLDLNGTDVVERFGLIEQLQTIETTPGSPVIARDMLAGVLVPVAGQTTTVRFLPISMAFAAADFQLLTDEGRAVFAWAADEVHTGFAAGVVEMDVLRRAIKAVREPGFQASNTITALPRLSIDVWVTLNEAIRAADGRPVIDAAALARAIRASARAAKPRPDPATPPPPTTHPFEIAGYSSDAPTFDTDPFNVSDQAKALCSVLAAREVTPPVSVGLFAPWGTGKTSFMKAMQRHFDEISRVARADEESVFCSNIVQLSFNAWHYIEQNLVASLANAVFEGLDAALAHSAADPETVDDAAYRRRILEEKLREAEEHATEKERHAADARAKAQSLDREIDTIKSDDRAVEAQMSVAEALAPAHEAAKKLKTDVEVAQLLDDVHGLWDAARIFFSSPSTLGRLWLLVALLVVAIPLWWTTLNWLGITAALGAFAGSYGWIVKPIAEALACLNKARKDAAASVENKRKELLQRKEQEKSEAALYASAAAEEAATAARRKSEIQTQIERLSPSYSMAEFVRERQSAGTYARELGVVATAHRDFRRLSAFLKRIGTTQPEERRLQTIRPIDRIVLYIDDLDRCPESKVVEVLQAVHLLLAFELFVVIIAVDSKWLLHSITTYSRVFQERKSQWETTPLNFLEKIIQIPFVLEPMTGDGYASFIDVLTEPPKRTIPIKRDVSVVPSSPTVTPSVVEGPGREEEPQLEFTPPPKPIEARPAQLIFTDDEKAFMKSLHQLMTSARNTKRFVNIYRLIRATMPATEFAKLIDAQKKAYEPLQVLVAVVTNHPNEADELLDGLAKTASTESWSEFVKRTALGAHLEIAGKDFKIGERPAGDFQPWSESVWRYLIRTPAE